jgi:hypothetical protein
MYMHLLVLNRVLQVFISFFLSMELTAVSRFLDRLDIAFTGMHHFYLGGFILFGYTVHRYLKAIKSPVSEMLELSYRVAATSTLLVECHTYSRLL